MLLSGLNQAGGRGVGLPAAQTAAGAGAAIHHDDGVAQLRAGEVAARVDFVVDDNAAAHAGAQRDGHGVIGAL